MNSISEIATGIRPIMEVTLECADKHPQLFPLKDVFHDLQLAFFWLKSADYYLTNEESSESILHETQTKPPKLPSLINMEERFEFIKKHLRLLHKGVESYTTDLSLPPDVKYRIDRGYDKLMEAHFNIDIANNYYEQIKSFDSAGS